MKILKAEKKEQEVFLVVKSVGMTEYESWGEWDWLGSYSAGLS